MQLEAIAQYRRDGYVVLPHLLTADHVTACLAALTRIAEQSSECRDGPALAFEPGVDPDHAATTPRVDLVRKFTDFTDADPALLDAAMSARLHRELDVIMGHGRVLMQEMALVKPPRIGAEKRWHQDAAYFRGSDPNLMFGVWIALDPATTENGCMAVIPGSHLVGPVPHVPHADINLCTIRADHVHPDRRIAVPLDPGDALVFHSLIHHYTAANRSDLRRRALQFHYHQAGLEWTSLAAHRDRYHDEGGEYAGCTVALGQPFAERSSYLPQRLRPVTVTA
ncbi:MAG TPA: phytanoyl-CoA dioxygenase family protein [Acetobacteraceae bacterium]|nr:phytanoyl-CoA dioxygenase family protein [Acetobacteraceae bacterium]